MKGVEYIMLEDKAYQIKACCGSDDLGQKEKGGSRLISVPSDPVSQIRVDGGEGQPVIKRQQNVGDDEIAYEEAETGLHIGHVDAAYHTEREKETIEELFPACESISIDYAVMEKAERIYVLPAEFGWSDLGSWDSLHSLLPKDERNNAVVGENVRLYECNNCIVHTPHLKQAVIQGLDGYIIAEKEGTLLICRLAEEQRIKEFSKI